MRSGSIQSKIVALEGGGLAVIVLISWLDEVTNLTGRLFGIPYIPNWHEALLESVIVLGVGLPIVAVTRRLTRRLHYLEGFVKMCAWCRKVEDHGRWTSVEE
ncbi:MAG TPA: hypothetical protein PKY05_18325, partial [Fibrobacteria bacterium]|nr:hypothetical protein [Fibrobacteria bacterium]